ncbi:UPF0146 family protein [Halomicrobium urmianum]|uniref:UPF0146 family protein n=1 Tax=Halomicrobium urmianum TaxID=1586233 RepID=UPI001CDA0A4E|nr:UPF0146 family protein [Halomicrobium urmianum]
MTDARDALVERLSAFDRLVEVGIGRRPAVAAALADRGTGVTATDVVERSTPDGVRFVRDDVTDPDPSVYASVDAVYALSLPPELHRPTWEAARAADAAFLFTTLGGDGPAIPVERASLPDGETLYWAREEGPGVPE